MKRLYFFFFLFLCAIPLQAQITPEKPTFNIGTNAPESDFPSEFSCEGMIIHPNDEDFGANTSIGKILIWTNDNDEAYHTPYQIADRVVKIEVKFPVSQEGNTVYFKVVDHDDESPYVINSTLPNTNYEVVGTNGIGLHTSPPNPLPGTPITGGDATLSVDVNASQGFKTATCYLVTTDRYSGDNYKVEASLDTSFPPGATVVTSNLVAWKRAYVDVRYMWKTGSYVISENTTPENFVTVRNTNDFEMGDQIEIFYFNQPSVFKTITLISGAFLYFDNDTPITVPEYAGVIKKDTKGSLENTTNRSGFGYPIRLKDAFGFNGDGNDSSFDEEDASSGGGFVEFILSYKEKYVPNLRGFEVPDNSLIEVFPNFSRYWHNGSSSGDSEMDSRYTLILGRDIDTGVNNSSTNGVTVPNFNTSFIATEIDLGGFILERFINAIDNTIAHEIGHQFNMPAMSNVESHVDNTEIELISNDTKHICIMENGSHSNEDMNAEFCTHHNNGTPSQPEQSCVNDIRTEPWPN